MKELEELVNKTRKGKDWCSISCKVDSATKEKVKDYAASKGMNLNRLLLNALLNEINISKRKESKEIVDVRDKYDALLKTHKVMVGMIRDQDLESYFQSYFSFSKSKNGMYEGFEE